MNAAVETHSKINPADGVKEPIVTKRRPSMIVFGQGATLKPGLVTTGGYGAEGWEVATKSCVGNVSFEEIDN